MLGYNKEEIFNIEQQEWMQNPNKCSACGASISANHIVCPNCGLKIKQNPYTKPLDLSQKNIGDDIKYHYKAKE